MKFEGTRQSGQDKDVDVYKLTMGIKEIDLMLGIAIKAERYLPSTIECIPTRGRLRNMIKTLSAIIQDHGKDSRKNSRN